MILTIPNLLSLMRAPLALAFLWDNIHIRLAAIFTAMLSDSLDGYLARRQHQASQLGAILDPLMDKFFMLFTLSILLTESRITPPQMLELLSRDVAVFIFGLYISATGRLAKYRMRSIWAGKITTAFQFFVLLAIMWRVDIPAAVFHSFVFLGAAALVELWVFQESPPRPSSLRPKMQEY